MTSTKEHKVTLREYLILLGLICQGFAYEIWIIPVVFFMLWFMALHFRRAERFLSDRYESIIFFSVFLVSYKLTPLFGPVFFVSLGNALAINQLFRLMWPLNRREKIFSTTVAVTHIAMGSQIIYDYRFAIILIAAIILIPGTLMELEKERFMEGPIKGKELINLKRLLYICAVMLVFFLLFPRFQLIPIYTGFGFRSRFRPELDNIRGASEGSDRLLFRIEGEQIEYIRMYALDIYNNNRWAASRAMLSRKYRPISDNLQGTLYRQVTVISPTVIGSTLPVDGEVVNLKGKIIRRPFVVEHAGVIMPFRFHHSFSYEYWTNPGPIRERFEKSRQYHYLQHPALSPRVSQWLYNVTGDEKKPETLAGLLLRHFHTEFKYRLGAPDLNRLSPIEDFLFNQKEGHCERFASTLAVLLRSLNVPSRVVIGYLATEKNALGGFYNIRDRHAHAWCEAWFKDKGWTTLDATPFGSGIELESHSLTKMLLEWAEYLWYSKIVDFGQSEQLRLFSNTGKGLRAFINIIWQASGWIISILGLFFSFLLFVILIKRWFILYKSTSTKEGEMKKMNHFYGRMLRILAKQHLARPFYMTPFEYLTFIEKQGHPSIEDIRFITIQFCAMRYGNLSLGPMLMTRLNYALKRIKVKKTSVY